MGRSGGKAAPASEPQSGQGDDTSGQVSGSNRVKGGRGEEGSGGTGASSDKAMHASP